MNQETKSIAKTVAQSVAVGIVCAVIYYYLTYKDENEAQAQEVVNQEAPEPEIL
jgi:hypothetical protein